MRNAFSRVIYIDFLGFGFSDKPRHHSYSLLEQADIVEHVLQHLAVEKYHLIAHDYGGSVALELLARRHSDSSHYGFDIRSLAIINGALFSRLFNLTWPMFLLRLPIIGTACSRIANRIWFAQEFDRIFGRHKLDDSTLSQLWYLARYKDAYRVWPSILMYVHERQELEERWLGALRSSTVPLCLLYGPASPIVPYRQTADLLRQFAPSIRTEKLADSVGHYPQLEDPANLMEKYLEFLRIQLGFIVLQPQNARVVLPKVILQPEPA